MNAADLEFLQIAIERCTDKAKYIIAYQQGGEVKVECSTRFSSLADFAHKHPELKCEFYELSPQLKPLTAFGEPL